MIIHHNWLCLFFAASRLNISMRKPSMKFLLNCGETPNLSLEGWDCSFKRWCQGGSWMGIYSFGRIQSSAKKLKVRYNKKKRFEPHTGIWCNLSPSHAARYLLKLAVAYELLPSRIIKWCYSLLFFPIIFKV